MTVLGLKSKITNQKAWRPILYICPRTGRTVQGLLAEEVFNSDKPNKDRYEPVSCTTCSETHFVNPVTGILLEARTKVR